MIRSAMQRVNPEGCLLRSLDLKTLNVLQRRKYQVYGPLALWHIDGNHKLIRYERWVICCWAIKRWANVTSAKTVLPHWCKVMQDSLGLWIPNWRPWILDSSSVELGSRFQSLADYGFLELNSGFQSPWFRIVPAKIFWIPDSNRPLTPVLISHQNMLFSTAVFIPYFWNLYSICHYPKVKSWN